MSMNFSDRIRATAKEAGIKANVVSNWLTRGVPYERHTELLGIAERINIPLTREELENSKEALTS